MQGGQGENSMYRAGDGVGGGGCHQGGKQHVRGQERGTPRAAASRIMGEQTSPIDSGRFFARKHERQWRLG